MPKDEPGKTQVNQNCHIDAIPKEISIPDDFEGVLQINIQSQKETETDTVTQSQNQTTNVAVAQMQAIQQQLQQLQNMMQPITVQVQQAQNQTQAIGAQLAAQLQGLQSQLQMLFMAVLGTPAGADAGERQQLLREIVTSLRGN